MSTDETQVDVPAVQDAARELSKSTGDFKDAVQRARAALDRDKGCWSTDQIGKGFNEKYKDAGQLQDSLAKLGDSLDQFATKGLPQAVENIQKLDAQLGEQLAKYAHEVEEYKPSSDRGGSA